MEDYDNSSRSHLGRAERLLGSDDPATWFYAALELRFGIEARMNEYLRARQDANQKVKHGWRMAELHGRIEKEFRIGKRFARWAIHDIETGELKLCFYYTPVTPRLKKMGEQLGNYLHAMKESRGLDDPWWTEFRKILEECAAGLRLATSGLMLGPAMLEPDSKRIVNMYLELPPEIGMEGLMRKYGPLGDVLNAHVSYPETLPQPLEPQALMWT